MTGEITLRGRVLPVGGVREKVLAAHRSGLRTVILPRKNLKDLADVPKRARTELRLVPVEHMDQVLEIALAEATEIKKTRAKGATAKRGEATSLPGGEKLPVQPSV